jgi:hypothetical protein
MKTRLVPILICIVSLLFLTSGSSAAPGATTLGTAITYQGRLDRDGQPYTGICEFQFNLWDAETDGGVIGTDVTPDGIPVSNGLFTVRLDFGSDIFNGDARWLEVMVLCPGDASPTTFPRQELTAAPYALYALSAPWNGLTGKPAGLDDGDDDTTYTAGSGLSLTDTTFSIDPVYTQRRVSSSCTAGSAIQSIAEDGTVTGETYDGTIFTVGDGLNLASGILSIDPGYTQRRVSGTCVTGSTIQSIAEDGTVTCEVDNDTLYTNGNGLNLISGAFSINTTYTQRRVSSNCTSGSAIQSIAEDGTVICETDDNTTYLAGDGLSLSTNTFAINSNLTQRRVDGSCDVGSTIRGINEDGSVVCQMDAPLNRSLPPTPTIITTLDSIGDYGYKPSITIGVDGLGLLSYYDTTYGELKVAHCNNIECSSADISTLDSDGDVGYYNSIAIGTDGLGLISYYDTSRGDLRVAHCDDIECSSATTYLLDSDGDMGSHNSITIGGDGLGLISYSSLSGPPRVAHCDNTNCSSATISLFDPSVAWGGFTSIVTSVDGLGLISYFAQLDNKLKVAHCDNALCSSTTITLIDTPHLSSMTLGSDGLGLILVGVSGPLKVIHCENIICDTTSFPSYPGVSGSIGSITIGDNGLPLIVYYDSDDPGLKVANCPNLTCNGSTITMLDPDGGSYASATIGVDGLPLIVYRDSVSYDLKVAHCSNMFCSSYLRRR